MKKKTKGITQLLARIVRSLETRQVIRLMVAIFLMALAGALASVPAIVLGSILDRFVSEDEIVFSTTHLALLAILGAVLLRETIQVLRKYLVEDTCTRVEKKTRVDAVKHLLKLDLCYFSDTQVGSLHGRLNRSIEGLVRLLKLSFLDFLPAVFIAIFALGIAIYRAPVLGISMAMVIPIGILIVFLQVRSQKGIRISILRGKEEIDGAVVELLGGLESVRALNTLRVETRRVSRISEHLRKIEIRHHIWMAFYDAAKYLNEGIFHVLVLAMAIVLASTGSISTGDILTFSLLFVGVMTPLREIHRILDEAHESSIRVRDLFDLMDIPEDASFKVPPLSSNKKDLDSTATAIEAHNTCYRYPGAGSNAVSSLQLTVNVGEYIGLCGSAGCGKSSFLKLLLRLIHAQQGRIVLCGRDLSELTREDIADMVCYVSQVPLILSGTVAENIAYGLQNISHERIVNAASLANIHEEVLAMPQGYQTSVGERGVNLSGGQRQRIAIARIFLRSPQILLLDEATSALDNVNENLVQQSIKKAMRGRTVIAVAHRLTTLRGADRILVFDKGTIAESGTFEQLATEDGVFARLLDAATENEAYAEAAVDHEGCGNISATMRGSKI